MLKTSPIKALLVSPPWAEYQCPNLSIGSLAAHAQKNGFDVDALHMHLEAAALFGLEKYDIITEPENSCEALCAAILFPERKKRLLGYVKKNMGNADAYALRIEKILKKLYLNVDWSNYALVGFTTNYQQLFSSLLLAKWIKNDFSDIRIVLGGRPVASELGKSIIKSFPQIDWCINGEGEEALVALMSGLKEGDRTLEEKVPGLIYRSGAIVQTNPSGKFHDLSRLPDPDYDHYFKLFRTLPQIEGGEFSPYIPIEGGRGCNNCCAFCSDHRFWGHLRLRPAAETASSMKRLCSRYDINSVLFSDLMMTPEQCKELSPILASHGHDYRIYCLMRAGMPKQVLMEMKRAGLCVAFIGVEALNTPLLKKMKKRTRLIDNIEIMKHCEELGIRHITNLMLGFPNESQTDVDESIRVVDYVSGYIPPFQTVAFQLFEDSPAYLAPNAYGIKGIKEHARYCSLLPPRIAEKSRMWDKEFVTERKKRNYSNLISRIRRWREKYEDAHLAALPLLCYFDCGEFLRVEDNRDGFQCEVLKGWEREIYLFCDSIRSMDEIGSRFHDVGKKDLVELLNRLIGLKLMFRENNDYLSLAVRSHNAYRRYANFV